MGEQKNIFVDIINDVLERTLSLRFDICKCQRCKEQMFDIIIKKFPHMPVDTTQPDFRERYSQVSNAHINDIMREISSAIALVSKNPPHAVEEDREEWFKCLVERIHQDRGLDFSQYHNNFIKRRIAIRMRVHKLTSYTDYLRILAQDKEEYEKLFEVLTINVSEFFRDLGVWAGIHNLLKKILIETSKRATPVKLWCAGCAHGEEPYSYSMMISELGARNRFELYATDVDADAIKTAERGIYDLTRIKNVSRELLGRYFVSAGSGRYAIKDEIKQMVTFKQADLIKEKVIPRTDLISCRNVFIYFTKPLQEQVLNKFYHSLRDGGYLVIGKSETILTEAKLIFADVDMESRIYRRASL